jgi:hypothetical protein
LWSICVPGKTQYRIYTKGGAKLTETSVVCGLAIDRLGAGADDKGVADRKQKNPLFFVQNSSAIISASHVLKCKLNVMHNFIPALVVCFK